MLRRACPPDGAVSVTWLFVSPRLLMLSPAARDADADTLICRAMPDASMPIYAAIDAAA